MKIRAVLFDIYNTLLEAGPPPPDADARWAVLWQDVLAEEPRLTLEAFAAEATQVITREHATARAAGVAFPEIYWNAVASEVLPELDQLDTSALEEFLTAHAQLQRTLRLMPGVVGVLQFLLGNNVPLGLVSNCQPYTLFELAAAFEDTNLLLSNFQPDLCFLSYKNGFSKPDPHVFRLLVARLKARGIDPGETLLVGDRFDNDIEPARAQGFQTWYLTGESPGMPHTGGWQQLAEFLES